MELVAASVPRASPVLLVPTASASLSGYCRHATRMSPILTTRCSKTASRSVQICASKYGQNHQSTTSTTTVETKKKQNYLSEDEDETETDHSFIETLELLEEETLQLGNDTGDEDRGGRQPTDYNRRAQIFDKCSKVFQALKHGENE